MGNNYGGSSSVAAKIMMKYGFKDGQGLGKKEQGMAVALQVEKTSKRGGRIIHEGAMMGPPSAIPPAGASSPPAASSSAEPTAEPSITEIMKSPSKVVLLRVRLDSIYSMEVSDVPLIPRTWLDLVTWTTTWSLR